MEFIRKKCFLTTVYQCVYVFSIIFLAAGFLIPEKLLNITLFPLVGSDVVFLGIAFFAEATKMFLVKQLFSDKRTMETVVIGG